MPFQLRVIRGAGTGATHRLGQSGAVSIGRSIDCTIQLDDPSISRRHCRIMVDGQRATIEDAGSSWGTAVNGESVTRCELKPGDVIAVGQTELRLEAAASPDAVTMARPPQPVAGPEQHAAGPEVPIPGPGGQPARKAVPVPSPGGESAPADPSHLVGRQILGYHIQAVLARARTGVVYRAMERQKNREVAFKAFYPTVFQDLTAAQRFTRAVNTMLPIQHENLVRLYAAGREQGLCYTASELVDGQSAAQMIQDIGISGMMPWQHALRIATHMARALQVAEQHAIVHRNVTPRNILIRQADGVAKLGDLIFAKALEGLSADIEVTRPGELVGDLSYMSPEQTGAGGPVDCRSDIYCLGATLYALLTGRPPLEGRNPPETIAKIQTERPEEPTKYHLSIPPLLEGVVLRMLAKRPDDRYQTAAELLTELERTAKFHVVR